MKEVIVSKNILITGISRGIGRSTAIQFINQGHHVYGNVRTEKSRTDLLAQLTAEQSAKLHISICDLSCLPDIHNWFAELVVIPIDVVICNAATSIKKPIETISMDEWELIMQVNVTAPFLISQWAFSNMKVRNQGGIIIQIGSLASIPAMEKFPGFIPYTMSKYAVAGLADNLAIEGRPYHIHSVCISPGAVDTEMLKQMAPQLETIMQPEEVADFIIHVAMQYSDYWNGSNLSIYK